MFGQVNVLRAGF